MAAGGECEGCAVRWGGGSGGIGFTYHGLLNKCCCRVTMLCWTALTGGTGTERCFCKALMTASVLPSSSVAVRNFVQASSIARSASDLASMASLYSSVQVWMSRLSC